MKKFRVLMLPLLAVATLTGCSGDKDTDGDDNSYKNGFIDLGPDFKEEYYPNMTEIKNSDISGKITIALVFDGKQDGWTAVAKEYERLHEDSVKIVINPNFNSETYPDKVKNVLQSDTPEWNIIQGNLLNISDKSSKLVSMSKASDNPYANNKRWNNFTTKDAFDSNNPYIVNSENLQTAWFINTVALNKAGEKGYKNNSGVVGNPETIDDVKSLCQKMMEAGYSHPLGLSLDKDSVNASQFSWLLRIYGDYYFRNEYSYIQDPTYNEWTMDLTDPNIETSGFTIKYGRLFETILNTDSSKYCGALSDKFKEFVTQFKDLSSYINPNSFNISFSDMRNKFKSQTSENTFDAPQIMLDYVGEGLGFKETENSSFKIDFFDNPKMISSNGYIEPNTLLRDVGGNGGYLSVTKQKGNTKLENASVDFIKFFLSPYGQSIFYKKLAETNIHPQGLTTVKNSLVVIPDGWKEFFSNNKVTFSGQSDNNPYISFLVRFMSSTGEKTTENSSTYWANLMTKGNSVNWFCNEWADDLQDDWLGYAQSQKYNPECYEHPDEPENAASYN